MGASGKRPPIHFLGTSCSRCLHSDGFQRVAAWPPPSGAQQLGQPRLHAHPSQSPIHDTPLLVLRQFLHSVLLCVCQHSPPLSAPLQQLEQLVQPSGHTCVPSAAQRGRENVVDEALPGAGGELGAGCWGVWRYASAFARVSAGCGRVTVARRGRCRLWSREDQRTAGLHKQQLLKWICRKGLEVA